MLIVLGISSRTVLLFFTHAQPGDVHQQRQIFSRLTSRANQATWYKPYQTGCLHTSIEHPLREGEAKLEAP